MAHGVLLTLPAYSHFVHPHTSLRGLVVLVVSVTPGVVSSRLFSHAFAWARCSRGIRHARRGLFAALLTRLCVGSLFSRYPSHPAWSLRSSSHTPLRGLVVLAVSVTPGVVSSRLFSHALCGLVVLAVSVTPGVVSSWLFSHALHGLIVLVVSVAPGVVSLRLFSHALHGLIVLAVSVTPGVVSSRLFSHALHGLVVLGRDGRSTGHGDREVGLWREIIDCVEKESPD